MMPSAARTLDGAPSTQPSLHALAGGRGGLPVPLTPFVGRQAEVAGVLETLGREDVRLLTLTGPGGVGKTRLALEAASRASAGFPDGVAFVELASVNEPARLLPTIARAFEIPEMAELSAQVMLGRLLHERRILLVLDNFEQIVAAGPELTQLLAGCPQLKLLVTSRVVLNVQGEHEFPVLPLSLPEPGPGQTWKPPAAEELIQFDSLALYVQRARAVQPDFALSTDNSLAIIEVCRQLDGLPLAIELAAARSKILTPEALLARLAKRLDILTGGARDQPQRLQTMRSAIAWFYELLEAAEQALFQQLAVFVGGFTLDAAEAVCTADAGDPVDVLTGIAALVDCSLVRRIEAASGEPRFVMLETVREFGLERLAASGREQDVRRRHLEWCLSLAVEWERRDSRSGNTPDLDQMEREHDNIRSALAWAIEHGQIETGMRVACWAWPLWFLRSYFVEGRAWMEQLANRAEQPHTPAYALNLGLLSLLCSALGDFQTALERSELGLSLARDLGDRRCLAICTATYADAVEIMGQTERFVELAEVALGLLRETNEEGWLVNVLAHLALVTHRGGDDVRAERLVSEGLEIARSIDFSWGIAMCLSRQGRFASDAGDFQRATALFQECLATWHKAGDRWRASRTLGDLADMAVMTRQPERAARLLGAAHVLNEPLAGSFDYADTTGLRRALPEARAGLKPETFERAWNEGYGMSWDEALAEALETPPAPVESPGDLGHTWNLSPRELEVLQLLVQGRTDREIATALFISPRTAQGHVSSIFNKLGVNSRTAAATAALVNGLVSGPETPAP